MKVLFLGGTGKLSKDVAALALKKGFDVFLLTRGSKERRIFVNEGYHMIYADIRNPDSARKALFQYSFDVVIDFLTFNTDQLKTTLGIIESKYKQYIFISSATAYKKRRDDEIISEETTAIGNNRWQYALDKSKCEKFLNEYFAQKTGIAYTTIRPYVTYGNTRVPYPLVPRNNSMEWSFVKRILDGQPIPIFDDGKTKTTLTHTRDFAKGVVGLFGNEKAYGETFHITGNHATWGAVIDELETVLGKKAIRVNMEQSEIYHEMPEYKGVLVGDKGTTMLFDNSKIKSVVPSFDCEVSLADGIKEMVDFYIAHPDLQQIDYRWNGQVDRLMKKHGYKSTYRYDFPNLRTKFYYYAGYNTAVRNAYGVLANLKGIIRKVIK